MEFTNTIYLVWCESFAVDHAPNSAPGQPIDHLGGFCVIWLLNPSR